MARNPYSFLLTSKGESAAPHSKQLECFFTEGAKNSYEGKPAMANRLPACLRRAGQLLRPNKFVRFSRRAP
jgi:hypothetical protein